MQSTMFRKAMAKRGRNGLKKRNIVIIILSVCLTGMAVYAAYTTITLQQMKAELEEERVTVFDAAWIHTDNLKSTTERNIQEWSKYPVEIDANLALRIGDAVISDIYGDRKYSSISYSVKEIVGADVFIVTRGSRPWEEDIMVNEIGQTVVISKIDGHILGYYGMPF